MGGAVGEGDGAIVGPGESADLGSGAVGVDGRAVKGPQNRLGGFNRRLTGMWFK